MIQLSLLSLTTSISNSFHPMTDSSINTSDVGERSKPLFTILYLEGYMLFSMLLSNVNEGLIKTGNPISF